MHHHDGWSLVLNTVANMAIVAGYLLVPFTVLRRLPLTRNVMAAGAAFFATCALTHAAMAVGVERHPAMVVNHVVQAGAVLWFVLGFSRLLRAADRRRVVRERGGTTGDLP